MNQTDPQPATQEDADNVDLNIGELFEELGMKIGTLEVKLTTELKIKQSLRAKWEAEKKSYLHTIAELSDRIATLEGTFLASDEPGAEEGGGKKDQAPRKAGAVAEADKASSPSKRT